jgi:hypothetical protein
VFAGRPGTDYPILSAVPYTNFYCDEQAYPGFFADMETRCQGERLQKYYFDFQTFINCLLIFFHSTGWHYCGKKQTVYPFIALISFQLQF